MLHLIGGPRRCGKSMLSAALAEKLKIPYFSIDHIASVIPPHIPPERQDESFPMKALRRRVGNDNDRFIEYAIEDEHNLILEGWQLLPHFQVEVPRSAVQIRYLYKTNVEDIVSGLKENNPVNDWVLRHSKKEASFGRIAE
jgi:2-phosphoglycerate kinase